METDLGKPLDCHKAFKEGKNSFLSRNKNSLYQLVYNELDEEDEFMDGHIGYLKAMDIEGDGNSSDIQMTSSQRVADLLDLSGSAAWSVGSSECANDTDLRIDTTEDPSLEDTFQTELKEARMEKNQLGSVSQILGSSNNNLFEDNADFSIYNPSVMHSTPIKDWNREVSRTFHPRVNISDILRDVPHNLQTDILPPIEDVPGVVRFFPTSTPKEQNIQHPAKQKIVFQTALSSTPPKSSFVKRVRSSLKKRPHLSSSHGEQIVDMTARYCGPPKFELNPSECFFDDDVAQLCKHAEKPNEDFDGGFDGLCLTTQDIGDKVGVLSSRVHFNTDDDYEDALSQDPSDWNGRDAPRDINLENADFSKYFGRWMKTHKHHMFIFCLLILALLFIAVLVLFKTHVTFPNATSPNVTLNVTPNVTLNVIPNVTLNVTPNATLNVTEYRVNLTDVGT